MHNLQFSFSLSNKWSANFKQYTSLISSLAMSSGHWSNCVLQEKEVTTTFLIKVQTENYLTFKLSIKIFFYLIHVMLVFILLLKRIMIRKSNKYLIYWLLQTWYHFLLNRIGCMQNYTGLQWIYSIRDFNIFSIFLACEFQNRR